MTTSSEVKDHNGTAVAFALAAVVASSLAPLGIAIGDGADSPFLFAAAMRFGTFAMYGVFLVAVFRDVLFDRRVAATIVRRVLTWTMVFVIVQQFDYALFALASRFVDISVVVVIFGAATLIRVFLMSRLFKRYQKIWPDGTLLLLTGLLGLWFAVASDSGRFLGFGDAAPGTSVGVSIAVLAAAAAGLTAFGLRWGVDLARSLPADKARDPDSPLFSLCCVLTGQGIANLIGAALQGSIGLASGESISLESLGIAVATGALVASVGRTAMRMANLTTTNLGINAMTYAVPVVSLVWLLLFDQTEVLRLDYLAIGAVAIVTTSLLISFEAEIRFGFKALIMALWGSGTVVYFRDGLLEQLRIADWVWPGEAYLGGLALSATVFTLLFSFRTTRLAARTQDEDDRIFALFASIDLLVRRGLIDPGVLTHLMDVDGSHDPEELQAAYRQAQVLITDAKEADISREDMELLVRAESELNAVVHSRRHGIELGELFALMIFGGITVLLAIASRPEVSGWTAFLTEGFTALFAAVIVFFMVHVWDMHGDRATRIVERQPDGEQYGVAFRDLRNRRFEQGTSIVVGMGIIAVFIGLFWHKWLGAPPM